MEEVDELIETYRMTNRDGRGRLRSYAKQLQKRFPEQALSHLTLVKNTNDVKSVNHVGNSRVDLFTVGGIGEAVNGK